MTRHVGPTLAAIALAAGGCAGMRGSSGPESPGAQKVATPQEQSQQALKQASDAQKKATEQAKRAAAAQQDVQQKQAELQAAQQKAQQEQQKAEQAQREANEATQQATQQAQQSQQQATRALSQQTKQVEQGLQSLQGQVSRSDARQLVVTPQGGGQAMTFDVTSDTRIQIDGRQASASEIQPGENALVSYEVSGTQPTARSVQIVTGAPASRGGASTGAGTSPSGTGSSGTTTPQQ